MDSEIFPPIPPETSRVALAVFERSNFYITVGDQANRLLDGWSWDEQPLTGNLANRSQAMLYLITIFQMMEMLPDQSAAEAVHNRVDWKYALHLPLNHPGQEPSIFCEFRQWLVGDPNREQKLEALQVKVNEIMAASDSPGPGLSNKNALSHICLISRVSEIYEYVSLVLETLATRRPELLRTISLPHWYKRYNQFQKKSIPNLEQPHLEALANAMGLDIYHLLKSISTSELNSLEGQPEIAALKQVWWEQYSYIHGQLTWNNNHCAHCSLSFSPGKFL
jgi:transposase